MNRLFLRFLFLMIPFLAFGQSHGALSGPTLGYLFDNEVGALRPILGIMRSSTVGAPIDLGFTLTHAVPLPDQRTVIAAPEAGSYLVSIDMGVNPPLSRAIPGAASSVSDISLSPHGSAAVLSYPSSHLLEVVTGLPGNPAVTFELATDPIAAPLQRVVVNDDASLLVLSFAEDDREVLFRWNRTEGYRLLASAHSVGAMAFVSNSDVLFADSGVDEIFLARDVSRQSAVKFLAGSHEGVSRPVGTAVSNRNEIVVVNGGSGTVMTFDVSGRLIRTQQCACHASGLYPLSPGVFRLTDRLNQTIYLLDLAGSENRIAFIPPLQ